VQKLSNAVKDLANVATWPKDAPVCCELELVL